MLLRSLRSTRPTPLSFFLLSAGLLLAAADAHALISYSGRGIGVRAVVGGGQVQTIADTGELPATGGSLSDAVVLAEIPGLLSAAAVEASTDGAGNQSQTQASITDLEILLPGLVIGVDLLQSEATAGCTGTSPSVNGGATIVNLVIGGTPIVVDGTPNQTILLPLGLGQIVLNQQLPSTNGSAAAIDVNALRLQVPSLGIDVALASSHADIDCDAQTGCVPPTLFSGRATVVDANVLGVQNNLVDTGPLPATGGLLQSSLVTANLPGLLTAAALAASTAGSGDQSASDATISQLNLTVAGIGITADVVTSMAEASCTPGGPVVDGDSVIVNLVVAGLPVVIDGTPNQTVALPLGLGQIVINEQISSVTSTTGAIDVTALRVTATGIASVAVSHTHADVTCGVPPRTYSGRGIVARVRTTLPPLDNTIGDTGALPPQGGNLVSSLPSINLPAILSATLLQSTASGAGNQSSSTAGLANVNVLAGLVRANVIGSTATATCTGSTASVSGSSQIANLLVGGVPINVTGQPNQVVPLIVGSLILNEQVSTVAGDDAEIDVNALRITGAGLADVTLGSTHADVHCDPAPACPPQPTPTPGPTPTPPGPTPTQPPGPTPTPRPGPTPTPRPTVTAAPTPTPRPGPPQPTAAICHHNCPDKIRLTSGLDNLNVKSAFGPGTVLSPATESFRIVLRNANGVIYQATLQPGDLVARGGKFRFVDKGARRGTGIRGGLSRVELSEAKGGVGTRVLIEAFGDLNAATLPVMTVEITVGNDTIAYTETWQQKGYGWYLPHR